MKLLKARFVDTNSYKTYEYHKQLIKLKKKEKQLLDALEDNTSQLCHLYSEIRRSGLGMIVKNE